ncbi:hypothetical protein LINPERHAP1_LOCUS8282 [Linum perenne]
MEDTPTAAHRDRQRQLKKKCLFQFTGFFHQISSHQTCSGSKGAQEMTWDR